MGTPLVMTEMNPNNSPDTPQKDPEQWATGDEPATAAQKSYLETLARDTGADIPDQGLSKARASELIDDLRNRSPRVPEEGQG
jgi:hypothetical protein